MPSGARVTVKRCPICRAAVRSVARLDRFRDERGRLLAECEAEADAEAEAEAAVDARGVGGFEALEDL